MMKQLSLFWFVIVFFLTNDSLQADDFEKLPDELIVSVLRQHRDPADVISFALTSTRHHTIAQDKQIWFALFSSDKRLQDYIAKQKRTENRNFSCKECFINYFKAIKNFKMAEKTAWFVIETRLLPGYSVAITSEAVLPPQGRIWTFPKAEICQMIILSKCDRDPRNENIYLLAEKDFEAKERQHNIIGIVAMPTSPDLGMLFVRGSGGNLSIPTFHKIVVEQVMEEKGKSSFLTGAWLKISTEPLYTHSDK